MVMNNLSISLAMATFKHNNEMTSTKFQIIWIMIILETHNNNINCTWIIRQLTRSDPNC